MLVQGGGGGHDGGHFIATKSTLVCHAASLTNW